MISDETLDKWADGTFYVSTATRKLIECATELIAERKEHAAFVEAVREIAKLKGLTIYRCDGNAKDNKEYMEGAREGQGEGAGRRAVFRA